MQITRDFLFVDLRKKLNSLTSRFRQVSIRYVYENMKELKCRLSVLQKPKDIISPILSFLIKKRKKKKKSRLWCKINDKTNQTEPQEIHYLKGHIVLMF